MDRQRAARLEQALHRERNDGAGTAPRQADGRGGARAPGGRTAAASHHQPVRAAHVLVRIAQGRHRAGTRRCVRGRHSQRLRPGAGGDRPRRPAR